MVPISNSAIRFTDTLRIDENYLKGSSEPSHENDGEGTPPYFLDDIREKLDGIRHELKNLKSFSKVYGYAHHNVKAVKEGIDVIKSSLDEMPDGLQKIHSTLKFAQHLTVIVLLYQAIILGVVEDQLAEVKQQVKALEVNRVTEKSLGQLKNEIEKLQCSVIKRKYMLRNKFFTVISSALKYFSSFLSFIEIAGVAISKPLKSAFGVLKNSYAVIQTNLDINLQRKRIQQLTPVTIDERPFRLFLKELREAPNIDIIQHKLRELRIESLQPVDDFNQWKEKFDNEEFVVLLKQHYQEMVDRHVKIIKSPLPSTTAVIESNLEKERMNFDTNVNQAQIAGEVRSVAEERFKTAQGTTQLLQQALSDRVIKKNLLEKGSLEIDKWESVCYIIIDAVQMVLPYLAALGLFQAALSLLMIELTGLGAIVLGTVLPVVSIGGILVFAATCLALMYMKPNQYGIETWPDRLMYKINSKINDIYKDCNKLNLAFFVILAEVLNFLSRNLFNYDLRAFELLIEDFKRIDENISFDQKVAKQDLDKVLNPLILKDLGMSSEELELMKIAFKNLDVNYLPDKFSHFLKQEFDVELTDVYLKDGKAGKLETRDQKWEKIENLFFTSPKDLMDFYRKQNWKEQAAFA